MPTYDDLVQALRETQQLLQVWNYDFVKHTFYRNANLLRQIEQEKESNSNKG